jgi:hypothetical protein
MSQPSTFNLQHLIHYLTHLILLLTSLIFFSKKKRKKKGFRIQCLCNKTSSAISLQKVYALGVLFFVFALLCYFWSYQPRVMKKKKLIITMQEFHFGCFFYYLLFTSHEIVYSWFVSVFCLLFTSLFFYIICALVPYLSFFY